MKETKSKERGEKNVDKREKERQIKKLLENKEKQMQNEMQKKD